MDRHHGIVPVTRAGLLAEVIGRECVVFDTTTKQAHCLAPLVAAVFMHLDGHTTVADLPGLASAHLGETVSTDDVAAALRELDEVALLEGPSTPAPRTMSRRAFARKTAVVGVGAAVLITTVATPAAAQASPGLRCPGSRCVSQSEGDVFCGCNNVCPPGSPGAGSPSTCTSQGLTPPFFDSCFCAKCPTPDDPNPNQVPAGFEHLCLPPNQQTTPCGGGGTPNLGCNDPTKHLDGICVPNDGDSSELCVQG